MSKVDPFRRRTYKAPLRASQEKAVRRDMVDDLADVSDACWAVTYECLCQGCDWCDPSIIWWREWQEVQAA